MIFGKISFNAELIPIIAALIFVCPAKSAEIPKPFTTDARIGELVYDRNQIFQIQVANGVATHIILGADEKILASAAGIAADCRREGGDWCIVAHVGASELFVQPRTAMAGRNNLELTTNLRRYSFEFVQSAGTVRGPTAWYRVTFRYPEEVLDATMAGPVGKRCNWSYSMTRSGDTARLSPLAVFDDGQDTYLMLPPGSGVPDLIGDGGKADRLQRVPGLPDERMVVLAGVHQQFAVRSGLAKVTIWNDGSGAFAPRGACPAW